MWGTELHSAGLTFGKEYILFYRFTCMVSILLVSIHVRYQLVLYWIEPTQHTKGRGCVHVHHSVSGRSLPKPRTKSQQVNEVNDMLENDIKQYHICRLHKRDGSTEDSLSLSGPDGASLTLAN